MDEERRHPTKITVRLSPFEARALWRLRTAGLPPGARPRSITEAVVHALLRAADPTRDARDEHARDARARDAPTPRS